MEKKRKKLVGDVDRERERERAIHICGEYRRNIDNIYGLPLSSFDEIDFGHLTSFLIIEYVSVALENMEANEFTHLSKLFSCFSRGAHNAVNLTLFTIFLAIPEEFI